MRIMALTGTPSAELLVKLGSDEVPPIHLAISLIVVFILTCSLLSDWILKLHGQGT